jgi:hypothetical protein
VGSSAIPQPNRQRHYLKRVRAVGRFGELSGRVLLGSVEGMVFFALGALSGVGDDHGRER